MPITKRKQAFMKIFFSSVLSLLLGFGMLVILMLNPSILYAHKTVYKHITIYHQQAIPSSLYAVIDIGWEGVKQAELFDAEFEGELCLNDGSLYPGLIRKVLGPDVIRAFSNKLVVLGQASPNSNQLQAWEQDLRFSQFLSHAFIHNFQFSHHGFFDANPLGGYPEWKWEGYAEYETLGRHRSRQEIIAAMQQSEDDYSWIDLGKGEKTLRLHVKYLAMTTYCLDKLGWGYARFMQDTSSEEEIYGQMMRSIDK